MKSLIPVIALVLLIVPAGLGNYVFSQTSPEVEFFYSETCPHCIREQAFLDDLERDFPEIDVVRYSVAEDRNVDLMLQKLEEVGAERYFGSVPLTFVGDEYFIGFDNAGGIGKDILDALEKQSNGSISKVERDSGGISLPIIGRINPEKHSLPALAIILGALDGFNVCSLGALVLILGMTLMLRSRAKIALYGGIFVVTTAIAYGSLIFFWYSLFSTLAQYVGLIEIVIGLVGFVGGAYFLREFIKMRKHGVTCDSSGMPIVGKLSAIIQKVFENGRNGLVIALGILVFAVAITVVEFPCSAAVPVFFAGILAEANLAPALYWLYISLFVLFYLLDELIIFGVAVYKMNIWLTSPKFVKAITFIEGLVLGGLGIFYLTKFLF